METLRGPRESDAGAKVQFGGAKGWITGSVDLAGIGIDGDDHVVGFEQRREVIVAQARIYGEVRPDLPFVLKEAAEEPLLGVTHSGGPVKEDAGVADRAGDVELGGNVRQEVLDVSEGVGRGSQLIDVIATRIPLHAGLQVMLPVSPGQVVDVGEFVCRFRNPLRDRSRPGSPRRNDTRRAGLRCPADADQHI